VSFFHFHKWVHSICTIFTFLYSSSPPSPIGTNPQTGPVLFFYIKKMAFLFKIVIHLFPCDSSMYLWMNLNWFISSIWNYPRNGGEGVEGEWRGWIQLWHIVRTFVNVTMYPQHNNKRKKCTKKERRKTAIMEKWTETWMITEQVALWAHTSVRKWNWE
jgi:hypothetical protein